MVYIIGGNLIILQNNSTGSRIIIIRIEVKNALEMLGVTNYTGSKKCAVLAALFPSEHLVSILSVLKSGVPLLQRSFPSRDFSCVYVWL
jgi:hypothetical protein